MYHELRKRSTSSRSRGTYDDDAVPNAHVGAPGGRIRCVCGAGRGADLSEPDRASRGLLCAGRHRRHRRAAHFGPARRRTRPDRGGGEPGRRQRIDRRPERGLCRARRPHASGRPAGGSGHQPALDQGAHLRSGQGPAAGGARHRRAACLGHSGRRALLDAAGHAESLGHARALVRIRRYRHARAFRRRVAQASNRQQADPHPLQGRRAGPERPSRQSCRFLLFRLPGGMGAGQGRQAQAHRGLAGPALAGGAGRADRRRGLRHRGFRHQPVAGHFRAARHAEGGGGAAQCRDQQGRHATRYPGEAARRRRRREPALGRSIHRLREGGEREVSQRSSSSPA